MNQYPNITSILSFVQNDIYHFDFSDHLKVFAIDHIKSEYPSNFHAKEFDEKAIYKSNLGYEGSIQLISDNWIISYYPGEPSQKTIKEASRLVSAAGRACFEDHHNDLNSDSEGFRGATIFGTSPKDFVFIEHIPKALENSWQDVQDCLSIYFRNVFNPFA